MRSRLFPPPQALTLGSLCPDLTKTCEKHENLVSVRQIGIESFGTNLTTLTEEVFGNKEVLKQYKKIINRMVSDGKSYDNIINILETEGFPLSINILLYIKSKMT